jgi:hypothetical protein
MWWLSQDKRILISKSRGDSNWCTPCRGNLIHTTRMLPTPIHVHDSYASCGQSPYVITFNANPTELDGSYCSWEKVLPTPPLSPTEWPTGPTPVSLPSKNHWSNRLKPRICRRTGYIGLLGLYHHHVISTFNTYSQGSTYRSLTDTDGGYNLGGAGFPHHSLHPSQPMVLRFPLMAPSCLRLTISI